MHGSAAWVNGVGEMGLRCGLTEWVSGLVRWSGLVTLSFKWTDGGETKR